MNKKLELVKLNTDYCDYLRKFDNKVPYNYDKKELRPFVGVLFKVHDFMYFAPLSSPKKKHLKLKQKLDFLKIDNGKLGAINFNNMLPVMENNIVRIDFDKKTTIESDKKYLALLSEQMRWLNRNSDKIYRNSKKIYDKYINNELDSNTLKRCCNFKLLEEKCIEYNKKET